MTEHEQFDIQAYLLAHWPREQLITLCAALLGVEADKLRAWLARMEH